MRPAIDAVLTTWPGCFWATMRGTNASTPWITPQRLTPIAHSQSWWETDSRPPQRASREGPPGGEVAPVGLPREPAPAGLDHAGHRLGHARLVEVRHHHVRA